MQMLTLPIGVYQANCHIVWDSPQLSTLNAQRSTQTAVVIDPGGQPKDILSALRERDLTVSHILLTHAHFDHILAAPTLQKETGAPVYVHRQDAEDVLHLNPVYALLGGYKPPKDLRTFEDGESIKAGGLTFTVRHMPGHSPGSCCLVCGHSIFSGDVLFRDNVGRVDLPGGNADDMRRTLAGIAGWTGEYLVYPGHGPSTTLTREQAENPYLQPPFRL